MKTVFDALRMIFIVSLLALLVACGGSDNVQEDAAVPTLLNPDERVDEDAALTPPEDEPVGIRETKGSESGILSAPPIPAEELDYTLQEEDAAEEFIQINPQQNEQNEQNDTIAFNTEELFPDDEPLTVESSAVVPTKEEDGFNQQVLTTINFAFDSHVVAKRFHYSIRQHAELLINNPTQVILLKGHTDERGSRDYNLALGENRAKAVKKLLVLYGANPHQVDVISFGEEKPVNKGHNEQAWAQNRRTEINY